MLRSRARIWNAHILELLRFLCPVFRAGLLSIFHCCAVKRASDDVVANAGQVFYPTAAHKYDAVLLEVMSLSWDVSDDLLPI